MYDEHWSDDQLIDRIYGVGPADGHLERCPSCARRWEEFRRRNQSLRQVGIELSDEHLAAQRRAIRARLGERRRVLPHVLVPALVTLLLAAIVILDRRAPEPPQPAAPESAEKISDAQLFGDVFNSISGTEPTAIGPIRSLFEEKK